MGVVWSLHGVCMGLREETGSFEELLGAKGRGWKLELPRIAKWWRGEVIEDRRIQQQMGSYQSYATGERYSRSGEGKDG